MVDALRGPWPWWVAGPLIGITVPLLLVAVGKPLGISSSLRHICAATLPTRAAFFDYDWKKSAWLLWFVGGLAVGGWLATGPVDFPTDRVEISGATVEDLAELGITDLDGLVPAQLVSWEGLGTVPGIIALVVGGFLVGFGARWAGGCTSGHAITGLSSLQPASLLAVVGFFAGGLIATHLLLPLILGGS